MSDSCFVFCTDGSTQTTQFFSARKTRSTKQLYGQMPFIIVTSPQVEKFLREEDVCHRLAPECLSANISRIACKYL